jgi:hypothetical protein
MKGVVGLRAVVLLLLQALVANGFLNGGAATVTRRRSAGLKAQEIVDLPMPDEIARENCMEDIVFCERLPEVQETGGGLFLPDKGEGGQHVARVVSVGPGRNEQGGWITPNTVRRRRRKRKRKRGALRLVVLPI